ncbi:MAG: roadblock/LC7 domain-containing protein [Desulfuromonadaceae bacterium]|jgi:predicted regulator of Ras-like GTPase activity (Roadblock/LC7/MglB family)
MGFGEILASLLEQDLGFRGAVLADAEGELIAQAWPETADVDAAALFGAHQGVIYALMASAGTDICTGQMQELNVRCKKEDWFVFPVTTEYYLALAGKRGLYIGQARSCITRCIRELNSEIEA